MLLKCTCYFHTHTYTYNQTSLILAESIHYELEFHELRIVTYMNQIELSASLHVFDWTFYAPHPMKSQLLNKQKNYTNYTPQKAESRADELSKTQISFKRALIRDIRDFSKDVTKFRADFVRDGPMVQVCVLMRRVGGVDFQKLSNSFCKLIV